MPRNKQWLIKRIAWRLQALAEGDLSERARQRAAELANDADLRLNPPKFPAGCTAPERTKTLAIAANNNRVPIPGTVITRLYKGQTLQVKVLASGFEFEGEVFKSLSRRRQGHHRPALQRLLLFPPREGGHAMNNNSTRQNPPARMTLRCATYTRKSTEEGLEQSFNTLDNQRESAEAFIKSQAHEGWVCLPDRYDDGGFTGANMERPALKRLLADIQAGKIDCVVVYKIDRLSRSLLDFTKIMEQFEKHHVSFIAFTQQINTTTSMGRLMMNVLMSFAQFEREIISERTRDKIAGARRKGKWSGGMPVLGYDVDAQTTKLIVNEQEAAKVRAIFESVPEA